MRDPRAGLLLVYVLGSCATPTPPAPSPVSALASAESAYAELRDLRDRYEVTTAASLTRDRRRHPARRAGPDARCDAVLGRGAPGRRGLVLLGSEDARALGIMRATMARDLTPLADSSAPAASPTDPHPDCDYDAAAIATRPTASIPFGHESTPVTAGRSTMSSSATIPSTGSPCSARLAARIVRSIAGDSFSRSSRCGEA